MGVRVNDRKKYRVSAANETQRTPRQWDCRKIQCLWQCGMQKNSCPVPNNLTSFVLVTDGLLLPDIDQGMWFFLRNSHSLSLQYCPVLPTTAD